MRTVFNFSAGPAMLPEEVLKRAQESLLDWRGCGCSVMELGHRSKEFSVITEEIEATLRELVGIPDNYHVLFLAGGATTQFSMVPLNLLSENNSAAYLETGMWSRKARKEAARFGKVAIVGKSELIDGQYCLPDLNQIQLASDCAYVYYTANETVDGIEFQQTPEVGSVPLVSDMTSNFLSRPVEVEKYGIIFASSQKNFGHAGVTLVIIRDDLIGRAQKIAPVLLDYKLQVENDSRANTPPTFAWYFAGLMFDWIKEQGGVAVMAQRSKEKINKLYQFIDGSDFYQNNIHPSCRSMMNVPFTLHDEALDEEFLKQAKAHQLLNLKGHRAVGGMRASVYLAMPEQGVDALVAFMNEFATKKG